MLVIDTCVFSEFAKPAERQFILLRDWFRSTDMGDVIVPVSVILEIECGIQRLKSANAAKAAALEAWLNKMLGSNLRVQPITIDISRLYARMASTPALKHLWVPPPKKGMQTPGQDLMIAATAITLGVPMLTYNLRDFRLIDQFFELPALLSPDDLAPAPQTTLAGGEIDAKWAISAELAIRPPSVGRAANF